VATTKRRRSNEFDGTTRRVAVGVSKKERKPCTHPITPEVATKSLFHLDRLEDMPHPREGGGARGGRILWGYKGWGNGRKRNKENKSGKQKGEPRPRRKKPLKKGKKTKNVTECRVLSGLGVH